MEKEAETYICRYRGEPLRNSDSGGLKKDSERDRERRLTDVMDQ